MPVQYTHTNIIARDWRTLVDFYVKVFDCTPVYPERDLAGEWVERLTQIPGCRIRGMHLALPGAHGAATLEIFSFEPENPTEAPKPLNRYGFAHIAFHVDDVEATLEKLLACGGKRYGEVVKNTVAGVGVLTAVYACDPEGNIVEIQHWDK